MRTTHRTHPGGRVRSRLLVAVVATAAVLAAACGGGSDGGGGSATGACPVDAVKDASGTTQVTLWHAYVGLTKKTLEKLATQYNGSQTKVKVNVEAQGTYEELLKKYEDALNDPATLPDWDPHGGLWTRRLAWWRHVAGLSERPDSGARVEVLTRFAARAGMDPFVIAGWQQRFAAWETEVRAGIS